MNNQDTEIVFPTRIIPALMDVRGSVWEQFIKNILAPEVSETDLTTLTLMITRMASCITCNSDSFRAMRGCTLCARQAIKRFRGSDQDLIRVFHETLEEVEEYCLRKRQDEVDKVVLEQLRKFLVCE